MRRVINSFTSGVFSPLMAGRLDMAEAMGTGCRVLRNFQVHPTGGIFRRSGLRYRGRVKHADKGAVLMPFQRDAETVFQLEAGEDYLRVWNPDGTLSAWDLEAPWKDAEVAGITFLQSNDVMLLFWDGPPQMLSRKGEAWELKELEWKYPPLREMNIGPVELKCTAADTSETGTLTADGDVFEAGHEGSYWEITHVREEPYVKLDIGEGSAAASEILTFTVQPAIDEQIRIGERTYIFVNDPEAAYEVDRGDNIDAAVNNFIAAVKGTSVANVGRGTRAHPQVEAEDAVAVGEGVKATAILECSHRLQAGAYIEVAGTTFMAVNGTPGMHQFQVGTNKLMTLTNIVDAVNDALSSVEFSAPIGAATDATVQATLTATEAGEDGNEILVGKNTGGRGGLDRLVWTSASGSTRGVNGYLQHIKMSNGAEADTRRIRITAKEPGERGNKIEINETLTNGNWGNDATTLSGGASVSGESKALRVTGKWEVFSVGQWTGTIWLEKKSGAAWETVRTWTSEGDYNVQTSGEVETEETLRLRFTGTGVVKDSPTFNAPNPRAQLTALSPEVKGVVKVTNFLTPNSVAVKVVKPLFLEEGKAQPTPTKRWAEGALSEVRGWPRAACFFEQRLALAGVRGEPERLYFSATADLFNFERTGLEDAGFGFDLAATDSSPVVTLASMGDGLFIGTETGEWIAKGGEGRPMSGSARTALPKNAVGSAGRRPLVFGSKVIFVENSERALREFVYDWQDQNYVVPDLTEASAHLMRSGIRCIAFARKPAPVIYAVTNDGRLLSCLYRRESRVVAWAEHTTEGAFEWVSVNAGKSAGTDDQVWFIVKRGGRRYVEKFDDRHFDNLQTAEPADMLHCDGAVTAEGDGDISEVSGLWHLNHRKVVILADGKVRPRAKVTEGKVRLDASYSKVTVGLPYVSEVQPMPFEMPLQDGAASGRRQKSGPLSVHFFRSLSVNYADSTETLHKDRYELNFRDGVDEGAVAPPVFTGWKPMAPAAKFRDAVEVVLSTDEPLPLNILAIAPTSQVYGA